MDRIRFLIRSGSDPFEHDGPNVIRNFAGSPKRIASMYVYDELGTELFERQCATVEYYLRRAEVRLLEAQAHAIMARCGFVPLVELGAGTGDKTRILIAEYQRRNRRCDYFPIDVDTATLADAARLLTAEFSHLSISCLGATYEKGLLALPAHTGPRLFLFLGSTIGNMELRDIHLLLSTIFRHSSPGDYLLVGADLDKDAAMIEAAYNDAAGFGARSTLNMLSHLNRRYAGDFQMEGFRYRSITTCACDATRSNLKASRSNG